MFERLDYCKPFEDRGESVPRSTLLSAEQTKKNSVTGREHFSFWRGGIVVVALISTYTSSAYKRRGEGKISRSACRHYYIMLYLSLFANAAQ